MANPGSKKIATHPQSTPQAIPLSNYERHPFWPVGKGCSMEIRERQWSLHLYTTYILPFGGLYATYRSHLQTGNQKQPLSPGGVFWCHRNIRSPAMLVCGFSRCQWVCREARWLVGLGHYYTTYPKNHWTLL